MHRYISSNYLRYQKICLELCFKGILRKKYSNRLFYIKWTKVLNLYIKVEQNLIYNYHFNFTLAYDWIVHIYVISTYILYKTKSSRRQHTELWNINENVIDYGFARFLSIFNCLRVSVC